MTSSGRLTTIVTAAILAAAAALHLLFLRGAGPFWRDELVSIRVAASPSMVSWWERLQFESFGAVWQLLLRAWLTIAGHSIPSLRLLGCCIGVGVLVAIAIAARLMDRGVPLLALAIAGTNAAVVRSGDAVRGYGLGAALAVLTIGAVHRAATLRTRKAWLLAAAIALAAVHTSYYDAVIVFACCVAAASIAGRDWWKPLLLGFLAALSLLVYLGPMRARATWTWLETFDVSFALWARRAGAAFASSGLPAAIVIALAAIVAIVFGIRAKARYPLLVLAIFAAGHFAFLRAVGYFPQPWYYAVLIVVAAFCCDVVLPPSARIAAAVLVAATALPFAVRAVPVRQTNADQAAALVATRAAPGDVVIVYPWYCGLSFDAYAPKSLRWMTLPPLRDVSLQRYDLVREAIADPTSGLPAANAASEALRAGHHVWIVGFPLFADRAAGADPRAMDAVEAADARWCSALRDVLHRDATRAARRLAGDDRISLYERLEVLEFAP